MERCTWETRMAGRVLNTWAGLFLRVYTQTQKHKLNTKETNIKYICLPISFVKSALCCDRNTKQSELKRVTHRTVNIVLKSGT